MYSTFTGPIIATDPRERSWIGRLSKAEGESFDHNIVIGRPSLFIGRLVPPFTDRAAAYCRPAEVPVAARD